MFSFLLFFIFFLYFIPVWHDRYAGHIRARWKSKSKKIDWLLGAREKDEKKTARWVSKIDVFCRAEPTIWNVIFKIAIRSSYLPRAFFSLSDLYAREIESSLAKIFLFFNDKGVVEMLAFFNQRRKSWDDCAHAAGRDKG